MSGSKSPFRLESCARPNILTLQPYRCARDDYKDNGTNILLDANENAYGPSLGLDQSGRFTNGQVNGDSPKQRLEPEIDFPSLNRYPDPHQNQLKQLLCDLRNTNGLAQELGPDNVFVGVGSDEAIDALLRCFCRPGKDKILTCPPTYGMYAVSAQVNDVEIVQVPLNTDDFSLRPEQMNAALAQDASIKLVYVTSPGNPTGNLVSTDALRELLQHPTWNGVVVVDEAYIDFAHDGASMAAEVLAWPNLVVMQTLSKAFGLAGIRLGCAFTSAPIARLLNSLKAPYNIPAPTSAIARAALSPPNVEVMRRHRAMIAAQRDRMVQELPTIAGVGRFRGGRDSNFLLVEILARPHGQPSNPVALAVYEALAQHRGVIVRFRGKELGCQGCLRITVGTQTEVTRFLREIGSILEQIYSGKQASLGGVREEEEETAANEVVA